MKSRGEVLISKEKVLQNRAAIDQPERLRRMLAVAATESGDGGDASLLREQEGERGTTRDVAGTTEKNAAALVHEDEACADGGR
ncbi:hypothetical protein PIB30_086267 [Stylosanthes scabra]|uniref:Uncharacterized protein n=1 Tax=Stylosanthes scabra TaxID=79078 RepID=A0ABU6XSF7_9FABA|nr:hypothetical protein [Stylosanthes scabra]